MVSPKDKTTLLKQSGVIYSFKRKDCDSFYIGESGHNLEKRRAEYCMSLKQSVHVKRSKGLIIWDNVNVLEREPRYHFFPRKILEAIYIRTLNPKLNMGKGLELDPVWDNLLATKETRGQKKFLL